MDKYIGFILLAAGTVLVLIGIEGTNGLWADITFAISGGTLLLSGAIIYILG